jgi:colicin V production protein
MVLGFLTILIMLIVTYAFWREGLLTTCAMCVNVLLAGLITFNFFEPLADALDPLFADNFLHGWEDALSLMVLFCFTLGILRLLTNTIAISDPEYPPVLLRAGGVLFGLATGYLASGVIVCVLQTLPWHEHFMGFEYSIDPAAPASGIRRILPPDRVWLGMMQRAGAYAFANTTDEQVKDAQSPYERYRTFDKYSTFEQRYARHRRYNDDREALQDLGEFDFQVHRGRK